MAETNPHSLILYDAIGSPCGRRVRMTLFEKGLDYRHVMIDLAGMQQKSPDYLALNPNGIVPTLAHGSTVVFESNVITEYLDQAFPEPGLYPADPWERAQVRMWQAAELSMAREFRPVMYMRLMGPILRLSKTLEEALTDVGATTKEAALLTWEEKVWRLQVLYSAEERAAEQRLCHWLGLLEKQLAGRRYILGESFSQADLSLYPRVAMFPAIQISLAPYPNISAWITRLSQRPCFRATESRQERGLKRLASSSLLARARRILERPATGRTLRQRLFLRVLRSVFRRLAKSAAAGPAGQHRLPAPAEIAPPPVKPFAHSHAQRSNRLELYGNELLAECRQIRQLLALKDLEYEWVSVDICRLEQHAAAMRDINPRGELPLLRHEERLLTGSEIIAEYLDTLFPNADGSRLFPADAGERIQLKQWLALETGTHKEFEPLWRAHVLRPALTRGGISAEVLAQKIPTEVPERERFVLQRLLNKELHHDASEDDCRKLIHRKLISLESTLQAQRFLLGAELSFADIAWASRLADCPALGVTIDPQNYPAIDRWLRNEMTCLAELRVDKQQSEGAA
jgi:glutathione S-transferase